MSLNRVPALHGKRLEDDDNVGRVSNWMATCLLVTQSRASDVQPKALFTELQCRKSRATVCFRKLCENNTISLPVLQIALPNNQYVLEVFPRQRQLFRQFF